MNTSLRRIARTVFAAGVLATAFAPKMLHAQLPATSPGDSIAAERAAATADTGRMQPAYRDLSRYDSPGMCLGAVADMLSMNHKWRRGEMAALSLSPGDTLPTEVMAIGRRCAANLHVQTTSRWELVPFMTLANVLNDDALFKQVVDRRLALSKSLIDSATVLRSAIEVLSTAQYGFIQFPKPARFAAAEAIFARLDALGTAARSERLIAANILWDQFSGLAIFDTVKMKQYTVKAKAILASMPVAEADTYDERWVGKLDTYNLGYLRADPNLPAIVKDEMERIRKYQTEYSARNGGFGGIYPEAMVEQEVWYAKLTGRKADSIVADYAFHAGARPGVPEAGAVTLFMPTYLGDGQSSIKNLVRLYDRYHSQGLQIVLLVYTKGYSWASPPQAPEEEAKMMDWYFHDYLKVPFPLLVMRTTFGRDDQGALVSVGGTDVDKKYPTGWGIVGRDGRIRTAAVGRNTETMLDGFVKAAVER